jgi:hypothetical protein
MEDEKRRGIGQRIGKRHKQACMSEMEIGANPPIFNALKVEMVEFVGEFITHNFHV